MNAFWPPINFDAFIVLPSLRSNKEITGKILMQGRGVFGSRINLGACDAGFYRFLCVTLVAQVNA
jgi:hypothetical protein